MKHLKSPIATGFSSGHKEFSNKCTFCLDEMLPKGTVLVECGKMLEKGGYLSARNPGKYAVENGLRSA